MAQNEAPNPPRQEFAYVDLQTGLPTQYLLSLLDELWRQIAAGFPVVPCEAKTEANVITLTPRLHEEGARSYGDGMIFTFVADVTSSGPVSLKVKARSATKALSEVKVFKDDGMAQAIENDVLIGRRYLVIFDETLDAGKGAMVLK